jgi:hypothetical protein
VELVGLNGSRRGVHYSADACVDLDRVAWDIVNNYGGTGPVRYGKIGLAFTSGEALAIDRRSAWRSALRDESLHILGLFCFVIVSTSAFTQVSYHLSVAQQYQYGLSDPIALSLH